MLFISNKNSNTNLKLKVMKKVKLYIRTPFYENEDYRVCNEITDEVYASTGSQELAIIIKNSLESHMNETKI